MLLRKNLASLASFLIKAFSLVIGNSSSERFPRNPGLLSVGAHVPRVFGFSFPLGFAPFAFNLLPRTSERGHEPVIPRRGAVICRHGER